MSLALPQAPKKVQRYAKETVTGGFGPPGNKGRSQMESVLYKGTRYWVT